MKRKLLVVSLITCLAVNSYANSDNTKTLDKTGDQNSNYPSYTLDKVANFD